MGWLGRLFGAVPEEEQQGICLNTDEPYWEVEGPETFEEMFNALKDWVPEDAILYFEGGSPDAEINQFMSKNSVPEISHVAMGTIWPRPKVYHVPATKDMLTELANTMEHHAEPELAIDFLIYRNDTILLEWYDAFSQPMFINGVIPEEKVKVFADKIGEDYRRVAEHDAAAKTEVPSFKGRVDSTRTLSSSLSFFWKYVFFSLWSAGFGIGTIVLFSINDPEKYGFLIAWIVGTIFIYLIVGRVKKVQLDGNRLYISNFINSIEVDVSAIEYVSGSVLLSPELVWFKLRSPTEFGQTIIFIPKARFFGGFNRHPVVKELKSIADRQRF